MGRLSALKFLKKICTNFGTECQDARIHKQAQGRRILRQQNGGADHEEICKVRSVFGRSRSGNNGHGVGRRRLRGEGERLRSSRGKRTEAWRLSRGNGR